MSDLAVVTGAFSYSGRQIAARLLDAGERVRTLTGHPDRLNPFGDGVEVFPFNFDYPKALVESLRGARTLYNTYWVRFPRRSTTFEGAVRNSVILFEAAREAGVERIIHISITNPFDAPNLPYFAGKAGVEGALMSCGIPYRIVRPTVMFGRGDVLINNIAWLARAFPFFPIPGSGGYRLQPVHVDDVADLCLELAERDEPTIVDAAGPEIYAFEDLIALVADGVGATTRLVHVPPRAALWSARIVGRVVRDVVLAEGELRGLMAELIVSKAPSVCPTKLSDWLDANGSDFGRRYESELRRNYESQRARRGALR